MHAYANLIIAAVAAPAFSHREEMKQLFRVLDNDGEGELSVQAMVALGSLGPLVGL